MMDQDHLDQCIRAIVARMPKEDAAYLPAEAKNIPEEGTVTFKLPSQRRLTANRDGTFRLYSAHEDARGVPISEGARELLMGGLTDAEKNAVARQIDDANWDHAIAYSVHTAKHWYWIEKGELAGSISN